MKKSNRFLIALLVVIIILLIGQIFDSIAGAVFHESLFFPVILIGDRILGTPVTPFPTSANTPTQFLVKPTVTPAPTMDVCPLCPTKTPYVICLPDPCP